MTGDSPQSQRPRIALVVGTLAPGGAEKQLLYLAGALRAMDADVSVFSLTRGEFFEPALRALGIDPVWIGRYQNPAARTMVLAAALRSVRPHIIQSTHFYTNLYVSLVAPMYGALGIGTARSDVVHEVRANGRWGRWLLSVPDSLIVNSQAAKQNAMAYGIASDTVHVLANVIDLAAFDELAGRGGGVACDPTLDLERGEGAVAGAGMVTVAGVGSFVRAKRFDRFLRAIARARARGAPVRGVLAGDGAERTSLEALAGQLGLLPDGVVFVGRRDDIPALLSDAHIFLLTSDHEGFPNVLLEAMAAGLPAVTTPAGDAAVIVEDDVTGFVVPSDDVEAIAEKLMALAMSDSLRERLGAAGRRRVELCYAADGLAGRLAATYRAIAVRHRHRRSLAVLPA